MSTEPYGTTPLPAKGVSLRYDPRDVWDIAQQPKSQQIAAYEGIKNEDSVHGATVLDVNQHFVIYAVKKGLIRILHRHSTLRTLFRGHEGQVVTDIQIFLDGDVLGSVGTCAAESTSTVIIWRVFERTPEIMSEKLLEITTSAYRITRLIWHPFNPNQFWIIHTTENDNHNSDSEEEKQKVASLVDTTRISTLPHETEQHAVCIFHAPYTGVIMDGVVELAAAGASTLTDLDWSEKDVRHVLTTHQGGEIRLWDLRKVDHAVNNQATMLPACICQLQEDQPLSRCKFLPHECHRDQPSKHDVYTTCFLTAASNNSVITLWSPFGDGGPPSKLQVFGLNSPSSSYLLDICYAPSPPDGPPPSLFVLMADQSDGKLFSWHLQSEWREQTVVALVGCDYVVPFVTSFPMYSWSTQVQPAADISEDELTDQGGLVFDMKLFSYQSRVIQCLVLTSFMCLPPASKWQPSSYPGVTVEELLQQQPEAESVAAVASQPDMALSEDFEGEDYDIGDDEEEENVNDDFNEPPAASSLPVPDGLESPAAAAADTSGNAASDGPFANWLGALAVKAPGASAIPPPPVVGQTVSSHVSAPVTKASTATTTMLTPADLFPNHPSIIQQENSNNSNDSISKSLPPENATPLPPVNTSGDAGSRPNSRSQAQHNPSNPNQNKRKNNRKGKSRSRSPNRNKQNGADKPQQQPQSGHEVTILQREHYPGSAPIGPPPGIGTGPLATPTVTGLSSNELAELFKQQESAIAASIRVAVQDEMGATIRLIDEKVRVCLQDRLDPMLLSINRLEKAGVQVDHDKLVDAITAKVEAPVRAAFAESMKTALIPAFQSVSGQMFAQISASLESGMAKEDAATTELGEVRNQLNAMTAQMNELAKEVGELRSLVSSQKVQSSSEPAASSAVSSAAEQKHLLEREVVELLQQRQYEAAFTKALSASTVEMALFVCRNANLTDVLGGTSPSLSQPILLCLMHQLGTSVVTDSNDEANINTELEWLQEVSLSINPMDESMKRHLPGVLQQLVAGINDKMMRTDQQARRPLQRLLQVLRGVQVQ